MPQLNAFEGRWRVDRTIDDHLTGKQGRFEGVARFAPDGEGLAYHETGELHLPGAKPMIATRDYLWRAEGADIAVLYDDGTSFHRIVGGQEVVQAWHDCGEDAYEVSYVFTRWPAWRMRWQVRGPRKDYVATSDFTRLIGG